MFRSKLEGLYDYNDFKEGIEHAKEFDLIAILLTKSSSRILQLMPCKWYFIVDGRKILIFLTYIKK